MDRGMGGIAGGPAGGPGAQGTVSNDLKYEVVLVIDELRIISFDRFPLNLPASVHFDDQVRTYLLSMHHYLAKKSLLRVNNTANSLGKGFQMPQIGELPQLLVQA